MSRNNYYSPFYGWLLIVGVIIFGAYLLWNFGLFAKLLKEDVTYLSSIILALFCAITLYLGFAAWELSRQSASVVQKNQNQKVGRMII